MIGEANDDKDIWNKLLLEMNEDKMTNLGILFNVYYMCGTVGSIENVENYNWLGLAKKQTYLNK